MADSNRQPLLINKASTTRSQPLTVSNQTLGFVIPQVKLLTQKNLLITFKNPKNILFLILTPFLLSLFLFALQSLAVKNGDLTIPDPSISPLPAFPQCWWDDCVSLQVSLVSNNASKSYADFPWIDNVLGKVSQQIGVTPQKRTPTITSYASLKDYYSELESHANRTMIGLMICGDNSENFGTDTITNYCGTQNKDYTYYLVLNKINSMGVIFHALDEPFPIDKTASALKIAMDEAIINYSLEQQGKTGNVNIDVQTGRFPLTHNRYIHNYDIVTATGAFYYMIPALFVFLFLQSQIVREKEYKLRQGLNIYGAKHSAYWISWFIIAVLYSLIASISAYLAGLAFSFGFFTDTPPYITILLLFFPFCIAMAMIGFMIATIAPTTKAANASSYGIVLLAIVIESFTADNNVLIMLFATDASTLVKALRTILLFYPPFSYTKIFTNITVYSGYHFDINQRSWNPGPHPYDIQTFSESTEGPLFIGGTFERYSDLTSMLVLYMDAIIFAILAWYFDHIVASNRGRAAPLLFPFYYIRDGFQRGKEKVRASKKIVIKTKPIGEDEQSAVRQRNRVYENSERNIPALGLRIKCLNKTFTKGIFKKQQFHALNQLTLQIEPGELMGILGHNGAGKTTLINILTGVLSPDDYEDTQIIINRQSIVKIDQIRKFIGLCAQFDILWEQLTAHQHLYLFASLKGIPKDKVEYSITELLEMVGLSRQTHNKVGGFSGGMKRRLSLAMAAIGNPKIILLDEPTTGLDPKVRQQVWSLIGQLKANRSIILTTHSMEEADVLADRVCVMVKGRVRCIGSSLFLKEMYGKGHRLTLNIDKESYTKVEKSVKKICENAEIIDFKGGNIVVGIQDFEGLIKLIKVFESNQPQGLEEYELKTSIRDWAVSHATLEEVFMAVSKQKVQEQ